MPAGPTNAKTMFFFLILTGMLCGDFAWYAVTARLARRTARPLLWRVVGGVFIGGLALGMFLLLVARLLHMRAMIMPDVAVIAVFIWHFILMPSFVLPAGLVWLGRRAWGVVRRPASVDVIETEATPLSTRRAFLSAAVIALPPLTTAAMTGRSLITEDDLRLRTLDLRIAGLPRQLDGTTIAHVTDPHLGSFISNRKVQRIISMTNELDADLVLQTGDLINSSLRDLPDGIEMMRKLRGRYGVYACEGNHDRMDDPDIFEADTKRAGLNMLLDEAQVIDVRGVPVRLMAPRWWGGKDEMIRWSVERLLPSNPAAAFPILLAHHPHAFDAAADFGVPLTLCGHTHGGQLALSQHVGVGPLMYRYWSGVYEKAASTCVVSNGTGNWFPLRINVPCEVIKITLHRA